MPANDAPDSLIAVLFGRGGIGKTKLLRDWSSAETTWKVLWTNESRPWQPMTPNEISAQDTLLIVDDAHRYPHLAQLIGMVSGSLRTQRGTGPHVMIITPHSQDLAKFNRDGSTGQIYVSHLPGHSEFYMIMPFKDLPQQ